MYDLNDLKSFVSVVETGNLSSSAKHLGVSKSTLSRRISHLEDVMRQPLMRRQANRMFANDAGKAFLPYAKSILDTVLRAHRTVDELKETVAGRLTVGLFSGLSRSWATRELFQFLDDFPEAQIDVYTVTDFQDIREQTDVVLYMGELHGGTFKSELLGELDCGIYAHKRYLEKHGPIAAIEELEEHDWVNLHNFFGHDQMSALFHSEHGYKEIRMPRSRLTTDLMGFHLDCIVHGRGIGILPEDMVARREEFHPGELIRVLPEWQAPKLPLYLLYAYGHLPKRNQVLLTRLKNAYSNSK
ncbi:LysR family transcriptional regulator [Marinomonas ostreistagni]|uniref:LysR family transcriptional regulator n=1 Tax=Marinomonas ostreistagni TaxID=359209 RepID=A0ABS0Z7T0_9GAMM|nr:LysR family transcriptional regulator [Marinomonas ostreistagni]MBJ7549716.1 LysR family transcriptional regulator [Marinomonas ostreistagni]